MEANSDHIILFDGVCNLCNGAVQYVIKRDRKGQFKFASLQSDLGQKLLAQSGLPKDHLKSFVYINNDAIYTRSDAALKVARQLKGVVKWLYPFIVLPKFIRDAVYELIARNRYRLFGKREACMIPAPGLQDRFVS